MLRRATEQPALPAAPFPHLPQHTPRKSLFDSLHDFRRIALLRFTDQQVNVVRHHDIADHDELIPLPYSFEHFQKQVAAAATGKPRLSAIATAVDEVQMIGAIERVGCLYTVALYAVLC